MRRKPLLTAALATGVVISGAEAHDATGYDEVSVDIIETLDVMPDAEFTSIDGSDVFLGISPLKSEYEDVMIYENDGDDLDFQLAQTIVGGSGGDGIIRRPGNGITLDNGIKNKNRIKLEPGNAAGDARKPERKKPARRKNVKPKKN